MQGKLKDKILLIVSAIFFFAVLFGWYGSTFPVRYESKTILEFRRPSISNMIVKSFTDADLEKELIKMNQVILNRATLEPMIFKYRLFEVERAKGMPISLIIEKMKKDIRVESTKNYDEYLTGFSITYRDITPQNARNVAGELAGKYVNQQVSCNLAIRNDDFEDISIRIVDPANLPQSPIYPTTMDLTLIGARFGLIASLFLLGLGSGVSYLNEKFGKVILQ